MTKQLRQASPPVDESISKHKHSCDAPPTIPHNEPTTPAARARTAFVDAFYAYGKDKIRPVYITIIAQVLAYPFCKVGGCSNCSGLALCVTTFSSMVHFAAISYAEFRDNPKEHVGRNLILLSLMLCSFCVFFVAYSKTKCVPS
ncbi:hypothetical protein TGAM01_v207779 [Trichoderma gamsii]|uniref:Uncharacterized protein n=1 Tax=Trichoderma gamsii TaxID=398673 RepID=A0A2P4ZG48_9HYPO|nr:hypothetical protein TGAM01_v207779 [Trichoderma gamsii]PON23252.1 hypothetical protein TGAM01_v207779 [Trichoderma gamsii]